MNKFVLVGDVGGTHARFGLATHESKDPIHIYTLSTSQFSNLAEAVYAYLQLLPTTLPKPTQASVALACPIQGDYLHLTNANWKFSITQTQHELQLKELKILNDWEAIALSIPLLQDAHKSWIGESGVPLQNAPCGLLGPGTGLGVSALIPTGHFRWQAIPGEGGHVSIAPINAREAAILQGITGQIQHISAERVISGMGLLNIYRAICQIDHSTAQYADPKHISDLALNRQDPACVESLNILCSLLGNVAGNLALTIGAKGGIYLAGNLMNQWYDFVCQSHFRLSFENKGRFASYLKSIPTLLISHPNPGLLGAASAILGAEVYHNLYP
ncbi:MAG: glucokinase [Gammaproteobacteria bacterium]|nr:glucokinase [Gammaproteobacteria bacterium]